MDSTTKLFEDLKKVANLLYYTRTEEAVRTWKLLGSPLPQVIGRWWTFRHHNKFWKEEFLPHMDPNSPITKKLIFQIAVENATGDDFYFWPETYPQLDYENRFKQPFYGNFEEGETFWIPGVVTEIELDSTESSYSGVTACWEVPRLEITENGEDFFTTYETVSLEQFQSWAQGFDLLEENLKALAAGARPIFNIVAFFKADPRKKEKRQLADPYRRILKVPRGPDQSPWIYDFDSLEKEVQKALERK